MTININGFGGLTYRTTVPGGKGLKEREHSIGLRNQYVQYPHPIRHSTIIACSSLERLSPGSH